MNSKTFGALRLATRNSALLMAAWIVSLGWFAPRVSGEVLVGDVFVTGFEGWTDTYVGPARIGSPPNWGILLVDHWLSESSDGREGDDLSAEAANSGLYTPYLMVNMADVTPATYDLTATMSTHDNDGFGIVFGYEDNNNYFRIGMRDQSSGNLGFPVGLSVQKVVNGTITQIGWDGGAFLPYTDGTPFEVVLNVDNSDWMVTIDDLYFLAGSDSNLQGGHYGVHSWAQKQVNTAEAGGSLQRGTVLQSISVSSTTLNKTTDFGDAIPVAWRALQMVNSVGAIGNGGEDLGNFRQDFRNGTIQDDTNGYEWATSGTPNIDFIGPAVVINEPGSAAWTNYQMKVRMENGDNDGIGLLVRVADDSTFYRINFSREGMGTTASRAPQGLSIQKCDMGSWSELFRDDQAAPKFIYTEDQPFDVIVSVVEDVIQVKVIDDPDGAATVYSYDPVVDNSFSISQGSVGFTNWGSGDATNGIIFSPFGGDSDVLLETISDIVDIQATVDRTTGNVTLENVGFNDVDIHAYSIFSPAGALSLGGWNPITDHYDEPPPGDGSVDSNDPWTIVTETENELTEAELSGGDGGTFALNTPVDLGEVWVKSRIEDLIIELELTSGSIVQLPVIYEGDRYSRSDLNTDGSITAADWLLFHPNTLADLSSFFVVDQALAGDLDGDGDNDVDDFTLFKADFEAANGPGSFEAMLASVPEPSSWMILMLGMLGALGIKRWACSIGRRAAQLAGLLFSLILIPGIASAVDFTTFTVDNYP
ncbi:MAG: PEP-CTERM sorting domain-containing protein, partial [Pirellulales bacterium]|nr:PEP-CTERM sorting domain-containing protein [Pirellulales bacterium]